MSRFKDEINLILAYLKSGNSSKFQDLYNLTYNHLKIIALKYAKDKNDCEDILLEAYIRVQKYIAAADLSKDGYNWLCKIVQNVAYDFNKKIEPLLKIEEAAPTNDFDFTETYENKDLLLTEISKLSKADQKLLYLRFWEDKSYSQIAKTVNGKKSTVHKRVSALIKEIGDKLKN